MNLQLTSTQTNSSQRLVLYFQVHQPARLNKINFFSIGSHPEYFDHALNAEIVQRVATDCYLPANRLLLQLIEKHPEIKVCFSISGVALAQFEHYVPEVLRSFQELANTGNVEFLSETNHHSLASLISADEFQIQVFEHAENIYRHFGVRPSVFRNTELIYSNTIGTQVAQMGFKGMITDGVDRVLEGRSPFQLYQHPDNAAFKLLLRNNSLSDDIAFRYRQGNTTLSAERYVNWLNHIPDSEPVVILGMDYETLGEHHKQATGIFDFLTSMLTRVVNDKKFTLSTPAEVIDHVTSGQALSIEQPISWADERKDLSAWLGNDMQRDAFDMVKSLENPVKRTANTSLIAAWRALQTSDHFYYMCTKKLNDGDVHAYFSHYPSPYEAFINYMNVMSDFVIRVKSASAQADLTEAVKQNEYERQHPQVPVWAERQSAEIRQELFVSH
ncbi:MAG: glycoside hydrolase family 57 protein [Cyclobacteriaceae bacterium]|nr:glycoside hydrolase family 57 protein [Cyclobacteriaceae bacterium]